MSNDYRNKENNDSRWYYSDGKRYVPRSMMEENDSRRGEPRSGYPRRRSNYPPRNRSGYADYPEKRGGLSRSARIARVVFVSSLALLLLIASVVAMIFIYVQQNILNKITFVDDSQTAVVEDIDTIVLTDEGDEDIGEEMTEEDAQALESMIHGGLVAEENLYREDNVTNILLLGTDSFGKSTKGCRSDAMIILSINENTRQIIMTSVMRDICVSIPGRSSLDKINAAHAFGGAPLAVQAVETNFGIDIDRYISISFFAFIDVVDALGGMQLDITEDERNVMNMYIDEVNMHLGVDRDSGKLYKSGSGLMLTGKQVLGYVRNRYSGRGDFSRTERQRIVLEKLIEECKRADIATLLKVIEAAASYMTTNYDQDELISLAYSALDYLDYEIITSRLPIDDTWYYAQLRGMSIINIDIVTNRQELVSKIYGK